MSQNKLISIKNPIIEAMDMCGADHTNDFNVFMNWAINAEKQIASRYQFIRRIVVLDIENCTACLPDDVGFVELALYGDYGCGCDNLMTKWCSTVQMSSTTLNAGSNIPTFLVVDIGDAQTSTYRTINYTIQNNKLLFDHNYDGQKITVQYWGYSFDCDGFLEISENHVNAIMSFICYRYFMRKKRPAPEDFFKIKEYKAEWNRECANARALDNQLTATERENIVYGLVHNPWVGIGLSSGMRTTNGTYYW